MSGIVHPNMEAFDALIAGQTPVLVDFFATWCGPCRMLGPVIEELAAEVGDKAVIAKVDIDQEPELARRYGVMSVPTLILFKGGEAVKKAVGVRPKEELLDMLA